MIIYDGSYSRHLDFKSKVKILLLLKYFFPPAVEQGDLFHVYRFTQFFDRIYITTMPESNNKENEYNGLSATLRKQVITLLANQLTGARESSMVQQVLQDEQLLHRYMRRHRGHVEPTARFIVEALKWRAANQLWMDQELNELPLSHFPSDILFYCGPDRVGHLLFVIRVSRCPTRKQLSRSIQNRVLMMYLDWIDRIAAEQNRNWSLVLDCSDCSVSNIDYDLGYFLLTAVTKVLPPGQKFCYVLNVSWFLNALKTIFMGLVGARAQRFMRFVDTKELLNEIGPDNLPKSMGGNGCLADNPIFQMSPKSVQQSMKESKIKRETIKHTECITSI